MDLASLVSLVPSMARPHRQDRAGSFVFPLKVLTALSGSSKVRISFLTCETPIKLYQLYPLWLLKHLQGTFPGRATL